MFTRKAWVRVSKDKNSATIANLFQEILNEMIIPPKQFLSDQGSEFKGQPFKTLLRDNGIKQIFGGNSIHAPYAERFNRTFQNIIYKYMTEYNTKKFVPKIQDLLSSYNNRIHRSIKMTPNQAELPQNQKILYIRAVKRFNHVEEKHLNRTPKFKIGDYVRKKNLKNRMTRGYKEGWSTNIYKITAINHRMPIPMYKIRDINGNSPKGSFYEYELSRTAVENTF